MTDAARGQVDSKRASHAAAVPESVAPAVHAVRQSLVRPMLYLGVERTVIAVEATLCLALVCGAGPRIPTFVISAFVMLVLHPTMTWLTAKDPIVSEIYFRSRRYRDFYAPHPNAWLVGRKVPPSVPPAR